MTTSPFSGDICIAAYMPLIMKNDDLYLLEPTFKDKYFEFYSHLGIDRAEMLSLVPAMTSVDILTGTTRTLEYIDLQAPK